MDGGAADLDSDGGVQDTNRSLEGLEAERVQLAGYGERHPLWERECANLCRSSQQELV